MKAEKVASAKEIITKKVKKCGIIIIFLRNATADTDPIIENKANEIQNV
jgi:hypothetical protein